MSTLLGQLRDFAGPGGVVEVPPGRYAVADLALNVDGQTWLAHGATFALDPASPSSDVLDVTGDDITIVGGTIDGTGGTAYGLRAIGAANLTLDHVRATGCGIDGIRLENQSNDATLTGCRAWGNRNFGIKAHSSGRVSMLACHANENTASGFDIDGACYDTAMSGCIARDNGASGFFIEEGTVVCAMSGCIARGNGLHGFNVNQQGSGPLTGVSLQGCQAVQNDQHGFRVRANSSGSIVRDVTLNGCVALDNSQVGAGLCDGFLVGAATGGAFEAVSLTGCRASDRQATKTQRYGLMVQSGGMVTETGNVWTGNATGDTAGIS